MNKTELINAVAEKAGLSKKAAEAAVNATLSAITEGLKTEEKVPAGGLWLFRGEAPRRAYRPESPHQGARHHRCFQGSHLQGRQGAEGRHQVKTAQNLRFCCQ